MGAADVWLRQGDATSNDVRLFYFEEVVGGAPVVEVFDYIDLADVPWLVSPVFISDAIHFVDAPYRMFGDIEALYYDWAWLDTFVAPPSTPISGSSPISQDIWLQILAKDWDWYFIIELEPIIDLVIDQAGIREESLVIDVPIGAEKNKPQYMGSEDDLLLLKMRGVFDSIRQLDALNKREYITIIIRCNGVTWWKGRVRFLNWGGFPQVSPDNVTRLEGIARGIEDTSDRQYIGMFSDPPNQDKYLLVLKKGHDWDWINELVEESEPVK